MFATRAKFYVTSREETAGREDTWVKVSLTAVYSQNPATENYRFWSSSPNGTMSFNLKAVDAEKYKTGSYWYVDCEGVAFDTPPTGFEDWNEIKAKMDADADVWRLQSLSMEYSSSLSVELSRYQDSLQGKFKINITNTVVWPLFESVNQLFRVVMTETTKD